jgi:uncharacterized membrane protein YfcA
MEWTSGAALFSIGIIAGFVSATAGGSNVITFPSLQWAGISSAVIATASNAVALVPGNALGAYKDWAKRPRFDWPLICLLVSAVVWGALGAKLLLITPEALFRLLVPALLGLATVLFAYSSSIGAWLRAKANRLTSIVSAGARNEMSPTVLRTVLYVPVAIYGGFFGAGLGILVLSVLSIGSTDDLRSLNVAKNIINSVTTWAAAAVFIWDGAVSWPHVVCLLPGVALGGLTAGWYAQKVPTHVLRTTVIVIGCTVTLAYAWRFWL